LGFVIPSSLVIRSFVIAGEVFMRKGLVQALGPPLAATLLLAGLIVLGRAARDALRQEERYAVAFADIDCEPPPGEERAAFLGEVQYLAGLPERLRILDDELPGRLAEAFARHPWVAKVERVEVVLPGQVRARLTYRTPVLAVWWFEGEIPDDHSRPLGRFNGREGALAVDRDGVLLPVSAPPDGLPAYVAKVPSAGPAGSSWGDGAVEAAARTAAYLGAYREQLPFEDFDVADGSLVLSRRPNVRVLWGHAPGAEAVDEAHAAEKVQRLLDYSKEHGGLDQPGPQEHDVRPKDHATHRSLAPPG
jgi:hypothetical protein